MRVVSGLARGTKLLAVPGEGTKPILDRVKTALFDTIRPTLESAEILDLFAGTGSIGIEALSQGASHAVFLDINQKAVTTINKNLEATHLTDKAEVKNMDAFRYLRTTKKSFDCIFVAPPQYQSLWVQAMHAIAERPEMLSQDGQIIVQIDPEEYEALHLSAFEELDQRKYGNTLLVYYGRGQ